MAIKNNYPTIRPSLDLNFAASKTVDPRITFTRASTATYYDGKTVALAEQNLLTYSQAFDNAVWSKSGVSVTPNSVLAPDNTMTGSTLVENTGPSSRIMAQVAATNLKSTFSIYAKANTRQWLWLYFGSYGSGSAWFDLTNGVVGAVEIDITAEIISIGNGWYRCSIKKVNDAAHLQVAIAPTTGNGVTSYTGDGVSGLYIWGAQLEERSTATIYTPTTTTPITTYIQQLMTAADNVPRIDHDPITGECNGLMIEETRTNLFNYSSGFTNAAWTKTNVTLSADKVVAPDGSLTARLITNTPSITSSIRQNPTLANGKYTRSIYVKASSKYINNTIIFEGVGGTTGAGGQLNFNATNKSFSGDTGIPLGYGYIDAGNGWMRVWVAVEKSATKMILNNLFIGGYGSTPDQAGLYIWGAQFEAGEFPTSYIPTTSAAVTRTFDAPLMAGNNFSSWYNNEEGTFIAEFMGGKDSNQGANGRVIGYSGVGAIIGACSLTRVDCYNENNAAARTGVVNFSTVFVKAGASYSTSTSSRSITAIGLTPASISQTLDSYGGTRISGIALGTNFSKGNPNGTNCLNGHIKRVRYYPKAVANSVLQALTM